jgi:GAF domain-containing protein
MSGDSQLTREQLTALLGVGRALVSELELEAVLNQMLATARDLTGARYAALGILDEDKRELERFLTIGIDEEMRRSIGPLPRGHGVLGELIRNPEPLRLADVTEHARSYGFPLGHPPMTTFLGVPIAVRGEAYGNLYLTDKSGGQEFTEGDEQLVLVLSEWAAVAIDNARLYENVERRRADLERAVRGLEATAAISRAVGFETELDRVLELIVKRGRAMSEARSFIVLLQHDDLLRVEAAAGEIGSGVVGASIPVEGTLAGTVVTTGNGEHVADLGARVGHGLDEIAEDARGAVVVPLGFRGRAGGVLIALDRTRDGPPSISRTSTCSAPLPRVPRSRSPRPSRSRPSACAIRCAHRKRNAPAGLASCMTRRSRSSARSRSCSTPPVRPWTETEWRRRSITRSARSSCRSATSRR